jgi:hypothetical protein
VRPRIAILVRNFESPNMEELPFCIASGISTAEATAYLRATRVRGGIWI